MFFVEYKGAYTGYDFYTYQLVPDAQWEKEFLDNLVTKDWPEDITYREYNEGLKKSIISGSKPWKVVHILVGSKKN